MRSLGLSRPLLNRGDDSPIEQVIVQRPLDRVLSFVGRSIHDVVNDPITKHAVLGYYKLHRQIERSGEVGELEQQWNPLGRRG